MIPMLMERDPAPIIDVTKPALPKRHTWDVVIGPSAVLNPSWDMSPSSWKDIPPVEPWTDDWIEWNGGECPVAASAIVQRKYRDGADGFMKAPAAYFRWTHLGEDSDIIAYRVVG